jgi:hypothetical protein
LQFLPSLLSIGYNLSTFLSNNFLTSEKSDSGFSDFRFIPIGFQTEYIAGIESDSIDLYKNSRRNIAFLDGGRPIAYSVLFWGIA